MPAPASPRAAAAALQAALQPGGMSLPAACQATDAAMTQFGLAAAITATLRALQPIFLPLTDH